MPLPDDFYDDDENYRIRLCMLVSETGFASPGSKINPCDGCGALIWVDESQEIPPLPEGMKLSGDVSVCRHCSADIFKKVEVETPDFIDDQPEWIKDQVKKHFGMEPPLT
jgi:hypothetical protein